MQKQLPLIIPFFIPHVGCRHQCVFCDQHSITGVSSTQGLRSRLRKITDGYLSRHDGRRHPVEISFYGGTFLGLPDHRIARLLDVGQDYVNRGMVHGIRFSTRPDTITAEKLAVISQYSVTTIEIGVQSMDGAVLKASQRGHDVRSVEKAVALMRSYDPRISLGIQLMTGLPGDNGQESITSAYKVAGLAPDFVRLYPTLVFAGSMLYERYQKGEYHPWSLIRSVACVKEIFLIFHLKGIRVIRMGLQADKDFESRERLVAGPYHPAFGSLVHARLFAEMAINLPLHELDPHDSVTIYTHPGSIPKMRGIRNANIRWLEEVCEGRRVRVEPDQTLDADMLKIGNQTINYTALGRRPNRKALQAFPTPYLF